MNSSTYNIKKFRASNRLAGIYLIIPSLLLVVGLGLSMAESSALWLAGQLLLGLFFFQCFILLHETGHQSYFNKFTLNRGFGHLFGFLSFIPYMSWVEIHNLHHRWTGWRDKDPTTEGTVKPKFTIFSRSLVNVCWWLFIPLFTIAYRLGNYWSPAKLKKFVHPHKLKAIFINQAILLTLYILVFILWGSWIVQHILLAYVFSLMLSDLFILSQHSHIEMPLSENVNVGPLRYSDQVQYTRSVGLNKQLAKLIFLNFNLHELHHAFPGVPAYHLASIPEKTPNYVPFSKYFINAKKMSGMKFIFSTSAKREF